MLLLAADVAATRAASMACDHVERKSEQAAPGPPARNPRVKRCGVRVLC